MCGRKRGKSAISIGGLVFLAIGASACARFRADVEMHSGSLCFHGNDFRCAIEHYRRATELDPTFETAWLNLAYSYWSLYNPEDASTKDAAAGCTDAFGRYLAVHEARRRPNDPHWLKDDEDARALMVQMWEQSKNYQAAIDYFEGRIKANPSDDLALLRLAQLNAEAGNWQKALEWYNRRAEVNEHASNDVRADIYYTIGTACYQRLHNHAEIQGDDRVETADAGLDGLQAAQGLRPAHGPTYAYINLLFRERALAEDPISRQHDLEEAALYYIYAKYLMTRPAAKVAPASQAAASQATAAASQASAAASQAAAAASQAAASASQAVKSARTALQTAQSAGHPGHPTAVKP